MDGQSPLSSYCTGYIRDCRSDFPFYINTFFAITLNPANWLQLHGGNIIPVSFQTNSYQVYVMLRWLMRYSSLRVHAVFTNVSALSSVLPEMTYRSLEEMQPSTGTSWFNVVKVKRDSPG